MLFVAFCVDVKRGLRAASPPAMLRTIEPGEGKYKAPKQAQVAKVDKPQQTSLSDHLGMSRRLSPPAHGQAEIRPYASICCTMVMTLGYLGDATDVPFIRDDQGQCGGCSNAHTECEAFKDFRSRAHVEERGLLIMRRVST